VAYKIAVTSLDGIRIDSHFNSVDQFYVLSLDENTGEVLGEEIRFLSAFPEEFPQDSSSGSGCGGGHNQKRFEEAAQLLIDCKYLLTLRIGKKPYAVLQSYGISALEVDDDIAAALQPLHRYYVKHNKFRHAASEI
jgi:predicted Fe-Mo cluster-binding NifX family protein